MHWPAFARPQRRTIRGRCARSRPLKNRLTRNRTSWSRTHCGPHGRARRSCHACRRSRPQGRFVHWTRPGLRNDHSRRRRHWRLRCTRSDRSRAHGRRLWYGRCGPHGRCDRCRRTSYRTRWCNRSSYRSWRRGRDGSRGLRRSGRRRSRKSWSGTRSRNYKFRRSDRRRCGRSGRLRRGNGRDWRSGRNRRLGLDVRRGRWWSIHDRRPLLFADDGPESVTGLGNIGKVDLGLDFIAVGACRPGRPAGTLRRAGNAKTGTDFICFVVFERTGMALFLGDSDFGKHVENGLTFDFQLSCQIVDSNLAHPPFRPPDCSAKSSYQPRVSFQVRASASVCAKEPHLLLLLGRSRLLRGFSCFFVTRTPSIFFDASFGRACFYRRFRGRLYNRV
jgi:hypothetical protein